MNLYDLSRGTDPRSLRCSHAERAQVQDDLLAAWSEGRLDEETYDRRVASANSAVTRGELDVLLVDLPPRVAVPARRRRRSRRLSWWLLALLVLWVVQGIASTWRPAALAHVSWLAVALIVVLVVRMGHRRHR